MVWLIGAGRPILFWILELLIPPSEEERAPIAWQFRFLEHCEGKKSSTLVNPTFRTVAPISMAVPTAPSKSSFLRKTIVNSRCSSLRYFPLLSSSIKPAVLLYALCLVGTFYAATWSWGWTPMSMCPRVCVCVWGKRDLAVAPLTYLACASLNSNQSMIRIHISYFYQPIRIQYQSPHLSKCKSKWRWAEDVSLRNPRYSTWL